ncbi:hypothetical protein OSB04_031405 [Centaurea solstitialis]|uniref:Uncharacterized protein n=1 Tax=Centaurea solstitialis TaxID=347529 RepID=A0AA38VUA1_9ASTR|nr:hypothetical protein OSB04_031405 [Centaurea solstitialis]
MDRKRQRVMEKQGSLKLKQTIEGNKIVGPGKEVLKKSSLQKPRSKRPCELVHKRRTNFRLQDEDSPDEDFPVHETMQSFSPNTSNVRQASCSNVTTRNQNEDFQESKHEVELEENSTFDGNSELMVRAINTQLASSHRNKQYRLHTHYKKLSTKDEAMRHPSIGIKVPDWVNLCERFACENFQVLIFHIFLVLLYLVDKEHFQIIILYNYELCNLQKISSKNKKNRSFNEVPQPLARFQLQGLLICLTFFIQNELQSEGANSSSTPVEICLKKLRRIPGYIKGHSASTKQSLATENLRMELDLQKERSKALEEEVKTIKKEQVQFQQEHNHMKDKVDFLMDKL